MGGVQSEQNLSFILEDYKLIAEQPFLKVLQDKNTQQTFALRQQCFANRKEYDYRFKKLTSRDQNHDCENILRLTKLWSKQHSGVCSNLFKIYTIYEYPRVKLIDEIEARSRQKKHFEEVQLFSILQSCMNALSFEPRYTNISPHIIFIIPQGVLKLLHMDLIDNSLRSVYNPNYYYSPEKIEQFHNENLQSSGSLQKQSIFCLGMTILHSALLESPNFCYEISNKRLNRRKLQMQQTEVANMFSEHFNYILASMLEFNPHKRIDFESLQNEVNNYFSSESMILKSSVKQIGNTSNQGRLQMSLKRLSSERNSKEVSNSLGYSKDTFLLKPSGSYKSDTNLKLRSERQIMMQLSQNQNVPKNHYMLEKTKKSKVKNSQQKQNQSVFKPHSGTEQMTVKSHINMAFSKDLLLSEYELVSAQKERCVFVIQSYEDNSRYEGMMQNNLKNGYGKLIYQDGVYYEGNFKNDCIHGKGTLFYAVNRPAYSGQWSNNKFNGKGVLYNQYPTQLQGTFDYKDFNKIEQSWVKFEGSFVNDIKEGVGKIFLTNGQTMQGIFSKGLLNGEGAFTNIGKSVLKGIWTNNLLTIIF